MTYQKPDTSHVERTGHEPRQKETRSGVIKHIDQVNSTIRIFKLSLDAPVKHQAGQWLDVFVPEHAKPGGFTITSPPSSASHPDEPMFELAIQHATDGPAAWLWKTQEEILGQILELRVGGSFVYPPVRFPCETIRRLVLIGGGVGVNPLVSILSDIADRKHEHEVQVDVLYGSKLPAEGIEGVAFAKRIADMLGQGRVRGSLQLFLTQPSASGDRKAILPSSFHPDTVVRYGRMSSNTVVDHIQKSAKEETVVYICGPPQMTDDLVDAASQVTSAERVMREKWW